LQLERDRLHFAQKEKLQLTLKNTQEDINNIQKDILSIEEQIIKFSPDILQKEKEILTKKDSEYLSHLAELNLETTQLTQTGKELKAEYDAFVTLGSESECPTCKRPLQEQFPIVLAMFEKELSEKRSALQEKLTQKKQIDQLKQENTTLLHALQLREEDVKKLQKTRDERQYTLKNYQEKCTEMVASLSELENVQYDADAHQVFQNNYKILIQDWDLYQKRALQIEKKAEVTAKHKTALQKRETLQKEQILLDESIKKLQFDQMFYDAISQEYSKITEKLDDIQDQIDAKKDEKILVDATFFKLEQEYENFQKDVAHMSAIHQTLLHASQIQDCLQAYISYLLHALKPHIETVASEYFSLMTDGLYSQISLDEDYHILIDGKTIDMYSGWEKDLAYLCFRLSLGQNLSTKKGNHINFLVLDEVLGSQDTQRQYNIFFALQNLKHKFSQILLISHHEDMKDLATHLIEVKKIDARTSEIVLR